MKKPRREQTDFQTDGSFLFVQKKKNTSKLESNCSIIGGEPEGHNQSFFFFFLRQRKINVNTFITSSSDQIITKLKESQLVHCP